MATETKKTSKAHEARAISRWNRISMKKLSAVVRALKSTRSRLAPQLTYLKSVAVLESMPQKGARIVLNTLKSAFNNLLNKNDKLVEDQVLIKEIIVNEGMSFKRIKPRARGRADRIQKRTSHVTIYLETHTD